MRKWIRWKGLIAFTVVVAVGTVFWLLLIDTWVKKQIERAGTALVGAKVELKSADVSFLPVGLTLTGLEVTDPDEPMRNAVEAGRIAFSMDGSRLLLRKVIIREMALEGVRFGTSRKTSGAIRKKEKTPREGEAKAKLFRLPSFSLPDVDEILKKEDLKTLKLVESVQEDLKREEENWETRLKELPDSQTLKEYEQRIKNLKPAEGRIDDILGSAALLSEISNDIKKDVNRMRDAKDALDKSMQSLKNRVEEAARTPEQDFQRLKRKYGTVSEGLGNATQMLVGEKAGIWVRRALAWYKKIKPVFQSAREKRKAAESARPPRGVGVNVAFREHNPVPEFIVRSAKVDMEMRGNSLSGRINNITGEQQITGVPITYSFSGEKTEKARSIKLEGKLDRITPSTPEDTARLMVKNYRVKGFSISESSELPLLLEEGLADLSLSAALGDRNLNAVLTCEIKKAELTVGGSRNNSGVVSSLQELIKDIREVAFRAEISGTVDDYSIRIKSDLDRVLKDALGKQIRTQARQWEERLKAEVMKKTAPEIQKLDESLQGFAAMEEEVQKRITQLTGLQKDAAGRTEIPRLPF